MRRQLPAYSPVSPGALGAGLLAALGGDGELEGRVSRILAERYGARDVLLTDSGTSALALSIGGATESGGRPVAMPAYSCYDLATAVLAAGASTVLYDVDPSTLAPDRDSLHAARSQEPAGVVYAPLYGYAWPLPEGILHDETLVIVDAAQGIGAEVGERPLASQGSVSVLSFGRGKGMTGGAGGAVLAHDERGLAVLERARAQLAAERDRGFGRLAALAAQYVLGRPSLFELPAALPFLRLGETVYHAPWPAARCPVGSLAVLERVIPHADSESEVRRRNAERLAARAAGSRIVEVVTPSTGASPGYLRLPLLARGGTAASMLTPAARRMGIAGGYPMALVDLPQLATSLRGARTGLPGAMELARRLLTFPTHGLLTESDLRGLERWLIPA